MSIDLSLHRIEALAAQFEAFARPTVHIAGTNGKGSVSALLTYIFRHAGLSVGRFNSPHLLHPSDSISLDGAPVSREILWEIMDEVKKKNEEHAINASSFEVLTICALLLFERKKVDVVLLEVGMGGRLDATNVIPDSCILVSVITAIDLDHQAFLGPTVEDIAREKAGIIRTGKAVVLASQNLPNVQSVVREIAEQKSAQLLLAPIARERDWDESIDGEFPPPFSLHPFVLPPSRPVEVDLPRIPSNDDVDGRGQSGSGSNQNLKCRVLLPLHGPHQLGNLGVALSVVHVLRQGACSSEPQHSPRYFSDLAFSAHEIVYKRLSRMDEKSIHTAVQQCVWPGRLSFHRYRTGESIDQEPLTVLVDGAHNGAAAHMLSTYLSSLISSLANTATPLAGAGKETKKRVRLTFILALSHSPPKTPASVLVPLLTPFLGSPLAADSKSPNSEKISLHDLIDLKIRMAFVRFSPPEGMPWIRSVPPSTLHEVVRTSFPYARDVDYWVASDSLETSHEQDALRDLRNALHWVPRGSSRHERCRTEVGEGEEDIEDEDNLVLVAGSLYLVADFYRLLQLQEGGHSAI